MNDNTFNRYYYNRSTPPPRFVCNTDTQSTRAINNTQPGPGQRIVTPLTTEHEHATTHSTSPLVINVPAILCYSREECMIWHGYIRV
jgi:hypothetical protein